MSKHYAKGKKPDILNETVDMMLRKRQTVVMGGQIHACLGLGGRVGIGGGTREIWGKRHFLTIIVVIT